MKPGSIPLVTASRMNEIDQLAQSQFHIPGIVLMETAGARAWALLRDRYLVPADGPACGRRSALRVLFVAGKGNNGGDALVMARHCAVEGRYLPTMLITGDQLNEPGAGHLRACRALGVTVLEWRSQPDAAAEAIAAADWVVDGLAGTGIQGQLRGDAAAVVEAINRARQPVVAIDCPSGIGDEYEAGFPAVRAHATITIGLPKRCLYYRAARVLAGEIELLPIGFPPALLQAAGEHGSAGDQWLLSNAGALPGLLPPFSPSAYKNQRGVVAVFAGAHGTVGAAVLCSRAAAYCGAGMVRLYADESVYPLVAPQLVSVMTVARSEHEVTVPTGATALVVGPGWGRGAARERQLAALLKMGLPGVIDADGVAVLNAVVAAGGGLGGRWVVTPHPGEFADLCGIERGRLPQNPASLLRRWARRLNAVIVLKGHVNYIARPEGALTVVDGMNPALGTAGSGDVLAGMVAALLGGGMAAAAAAEAAVLLHQCAGRRLYVDRGFFLAEDLPHEVAVLLARYAAASTDDSSE
ncbi:MAG: NAD(P)H-hydrate dehydratase [Spirochaetaceae bacterium]|nr:MAG: NAD(P)H-hydrate dehydratase [Spirochaetaceae bacterium]